MLLTVGSCQVGVPNRFYFSTHTPYFLLQIAVTASYRRRIYIQPYYRGSRYTGKISPALNTRSLLADEAGIPRTYFATFDKRGKAFSYTAHQGRTWVFSFFSRHSMHTHRYTQHGHWLDLTGQDITQTLKYGLQYTAANRNNMSLDFEVSVPVKNVKIRRF